MLVLASASPRRQELLRNAGIQFTVQVADVPEIPLADEPPRSFAERMAREKALAVSRGRPNDDDVVLGADTIVVVQGQILGKPRDEADAARMLRLLSGRTHTVTTGVCLVGQSQGTGTARLLDVRSETSTVTFTALDDSDIQFYISTGEPLDKAGAYAIQGIASRWITRIEGDYCNVVGLPVALVWRMLREQKVV